MSKFYGVYSVSEEQLSVFHYVGTEMECLQYKINLCQWAGIDMPFVYIRELTGEQDEIWAIRAEVARARGEVEPVLFDDQLIGVTPGVDKEMELDNNLWLFEEYQRTTKERETLQEKWEGLRRSRNLWWSLFKEEMDANWLKLDVYDTKLNRVRGINQSTCLIPTEEQWTEAFMRRTRIWKSCEQMQEKRRSMTFEIYKKAMAATKRCQAFWKTKEGKALTSLNQRRSTLWMCIQDLDCTFEDYNNLVNQEINPYWTTGESEEVDEMALMAQNAVETMDILEETHMEEMSAFEAGESRSSPFWDYEYRTDKANRNSPVYFVREDNMVVGRNGAAQSNASQVGEDDWNSLLSSLE